MTVDRLGDLLGAFRDVQVWFMAEAAGRLGVRESPQGPVQPAAALVDPTGRRAITLLSDCSGPHWWDGRMAPAVHQWAASGPAAILQPLGERLWRRTAARIVPGQAVLARPGAPNTEIRFTPHHPGARTRAPGAVPVPVVELAPDWLGDWARLVAGTGGPRDTAVTYLSPQPAPARRTAVDTERDLPVRDIAVALASDSPSLRISALRDLVAWLDDPDPARVLAARNELDSIANYDIREVADAARSLLPARVSSADQFLAKDDTPKDQHLAEPDVPPRVEPSVPAAVAGYLPV